MFCIPYEPHACADTVIALRLFPSYYPLHVNKCPLNSTDYLAISTITAVRERLGSALIEPQTTKGGGCWIYCPLSYFTFHMSMELIYIDI